MRQHSESGGWLRLSGPLLTAFIASGIVMVIELTAGKLVSRYLGMSLFTWTGIIAVVLAGMAVGNGVGGYIADRWRPRRALALLFALAALSCLLLLPLNDLLGSMAPLQGMSWPARIFTHCLLLFFLPAVALGGISPVVARIALGLGGPEGSTVGAVYAAGVAGSIIGTFLTGYWLVLYLGVQAIVVFSAGGMLCLAVLYGIWALLSQETAPEPPTPVEGDLGEFPWWTAIATVFTSNMCFMVLELGAARVLARGFGSSIYTWTATIGVFLAGITIGNLIGGWLADRSASRTTIARCFLGASFFAALSPFYAHVTYLFMDSVPMLQQVEWGTRVALYMFGGFFLPSLFIGTISPIVVKRGLEAGRAPGNTVAAVYAWGTAGAVTGTLLTGYLLIDWMGSLPVVVLSALVLVLCAVLYAERIALTATWLVLCLFLFFCALSSSPSIAPIGDFLQINPRPYPGLLYEDESQYSYIAVIATDPSQRDRTLQLDKLSHSEIDLDRPNTFKQEYEWLYDGIVRKFFPARAPLRSFFIGGGGFIFPNYFDRTRPGSHTEVTEIDPAVTAAAFAYFGIPENHGMDVHNMDARNRMTSIVQAKRAGVNIPPYDLVVGDSFNDFSVPSHLTTREFAQDVNEILGDNGIYMINMIDVYDPGLFLGAMVNTLRQVFPHVYVFNSGAPPNVRDTFVLICSRTPRDLSGIVEGVQHIYPYVGEVLTQAALDTLVERSGTLTLTDDHAPTELLLRHVVRRPFGTDGQAAYQDSLTKRAHGETAAAMELLEKAIESHPSWAKPRTQLADLLYATGDTQGAIAQYRAAMATSADPAEMHFQVASILINTGQRAAGLAEMETAIAKRSDHYQALEALGALMLEDGKVDEAIAYLERAAILDTKTIGARFNLGFAYSSKQDYARAAEQWEACLKIDETHEDSISNLVLAYSSLKDYDRAWRTMQRFDQLGIERPETLVKDLQQASGREE